MDRILRLHESLLFTILGVCALLVAWALIAALRGRPLAELFRSGMLIAELLVLAEIVLGVLLLLQGRRPVRLEMHILYAVVAALTLPIAYASGRSRPPRPQALIYAFGCLFVAVIALRAVETARPPGT